MTRAYLGLGSNIGDRSAHLAQGLRGIDALPHTKITAVSGLYETEPVGPIEQSHFYNIGIAIETALSPRLLLDSALAIEATAGRQRRERWGPRTLDIDIIAFGRRQIEEDGLTIPHPRIAERAFVLMPLCDIAPDLVIAGKTVRQWLGLLDTAGVKRLGTMQGLEVPS